MLTEKETMCRLDPFRSTIGTADEAEKLKQPNDTFKATYVP